MPVYKKAIVLGKFMPLHQGHLALMRFALAQAHEAVAVVDAPLGSWPEEKIRAGWIDSEIPKMKTAILFGPTPQEPHERSDFWEHWTKLLKDAAPKADCIVSSESYGPALARRLGIAHVEFDAPRIAHPYGARDLRGGFLPEQRSLLAGSARKDCSILMVMRGPESCGKTTFGKSLQADPRCLFVPEAAERLIAAGADPRDPSSLEQFALAQTKAIDSALSGGPGIVIADSDAFSTHVWAQTLLGANHPMAKRIFDIASSARKADLALLFEPTIPWAQDVHRSFMSSQEAQNIRTSMFASLKRLSDQIAETNISVDPIQLSYGVLPVEWIAKARILRQMPSAFALAPTEKTPTMK